MRRTATALTFLTALLAFLSPTVLHSQQARIDSMLVRTSGAAIYLRTERTDSGTFSAVMDLAALLRADQYENRALKKLEVKFARSSVKFTAGNAFVVVTIPNTKRNRVYQFSSPAILRNGQYYAVTEDMLAVFQYAGDSTLSVDAPTPSMPGVAPVVTGLSVDEKKNGTLFRIHLTGRVPDANRSKQIGEWIYLTMPGAQCDTVAYDTTFSSGLIRRVRPVQSETSLQMSLQLRGKVEQTELVQDPLSNDLLLTLIPAMPESKNEAKVDSSAIRRRNAERARQEVVKSIAKQKEKWKLDVVVIDPGHGGHDPGTIGLIGTREKDITLGIALKLGEMIRTELPDVKVVYTRKTDRFVELYRRGQIANENEGKIFISIHCNATERKPSSANGFEIYLLRPGKTEDAIRIAEKENDVVKLEKDYEDRYQELTEENFIILTMAQSSYVKASERFAELLEETMSSQMEGQRQPVKQAGFYVLVGASMPNVLVETGYLSNVKDERFLRSPGGQKKVAAAILNGLKAYKHEYENDIR